jgi:hypothetical protein
MLPDPCPSLFTNQDEGKGKADTDHNQEDYSKENCDSQEDNTEKGCSQTCNEETIAEQES